MTVTSCCSALGSSIVNIKYFAEANIAAATIFQMIERIPSIDSTDPKGETINDVKGELEFKDTDFAYPTRPDNLVLRKFNLKVIPRQTVGLVGGSGSGKSTVINLLERFYDPLGGEVLLDGINIKTLQLKWLRKQMALVSQEPILFATSIKENILFGKAEASEEEIIQAAKAANAHNFITQLPDGYDTLVGQMSFAYALAYLCQYFLGIFSVCKRTLCIFRWVNLEFRCLEGRNRGFPLQEHCS